LDRDEPSEVRINALKGLRDCPWPAPDRPVVAETILRVAQANDSPDRVEGERRLPLAVEETLYRIAQEALNNVFKHASAHQVAVRLRFSDGDVALEIGDDGIGFDPAIMPSPGRLGLRGMQERIRNVQGTLHVDSAPGKGTRVCVTVNTHDLCGDHEAYRRQRQGVLDAPLSSTVTTPTVPRKAARRKPGRWMVRAERCGQRSTLTVAFHEKDRCWSE